MKAVKKNFMSYIKLFYVYVKFNEPIKVAHLQKLANQLMLNGALKMAILSVKARKTFVVKRGTF